MNLDGVNVDWVRETLTAYVTAVRPVYRGSDFFATPDVGRPQAIQLTEVVRAIFDRLYPSWRTENTVDQYDEFAAERDASQRLLSRIESFEALKENLGGADTSPRITAASLQPLIWDAAKAQWNLGHYHEAVHAASKAVNSLLQTKVGRRDVSERDLVQQAFSDKAPEPGKARLRFTHIRDEQTLESMRQGVMFFGSGCFGAIRNPLGHLPNEEVELDEQTALEQLAALSLFARWVDQANVEQA